MSEPVEGVASAPIATSVRPSVSLADAARQFEAFLVGEMLNHANRSPSNTGLLDGGDAGRMYREMLHQEIARLVVQRGGLGLARAIEHAANRSIRDDVRPMTRP